MSSSARVNRLAERKQLLMLQADLHRQLIGMERIRWHTRFDSAHEQFHSQRWWVIGAVAGAGLLLARHLGGLTRWLPMAYTAARVAKSWRR